MVNAVDFLVNQIKDGGPENIQQSFLAFGNGGQQPEGNHVVGFASAHGLEQLEYDLFAFAIDLLDGSAQKFGYTLGHVITAIDLYRPSKLQCFGKINRFLDETT